MAKHKKMSVTAQTAAARQLVSEGSSLDTIEAEHSYLSDGVAFLREEATKPPKRGSGATASAARPSYKI